MATIVSHQSLHGLKSESGLLSDMVGPNPVDDVRKDVLLTEGNPNSNASWCYWMPFPGVRYYCFGKNASTLDPVEQSRRGSST